MPHGVLPLAPALDIVQERDRLVRLCARITGAPDVAEDLAQETLVEALRSQRRLRDPSAAPAWLAGIARNVCLRWARRASRELPRERDWSGDDDGDHAPEFADRIPDGFAFETELDRRELADLLDRAMALLPPDTRAALVLRYVEESPYSEIAGRLATSEAAVAMRLQRGRLALQRLLTTDLRREAAAFGLARDSDDESWADTRIWCPVCAQRRMQARFAGGAAEFWLRCPGCHAAPSAPAWHSQLRDLPPLLRSAGGHSAILDAVLKRSDRRYGGVLRGEPAACWRCGRLVAVRQESPLDAPAVYRGLPTVSLVCASCGASSSSHLSGLILSLPEGRRYWRQHQRILVRPHQDVTVAGRPAYRTLLESVGGAARLEVLSDRESLRTVLVDGGEITR